jgi:hypothetical protein
VMLPLPDAPIRSKIDRIANPEDAGIVPGASGTDATANLFRCTLDHPDRCSGTDQIRLFNSIAREPPKGSILI